MKSQSAREADALQTEAFLRTTEVAMTHVRNLALRCAVLLSIFLPTGRLLIAAEDIEPPDPAAAAGAPGQNGTPMHPDGTAGGDGLNITATASAGNPDPTANAQATGG